MLDTVGKLKPVCLGHALRHESLLHDIIEGRMKEKASRGRKRMHPLSELMENRSYMEVKREAQDRAGWRVGVS